MASEAQDYGDFRWYVVLVRRERSPFSCLPAGISFYLIAM